jgi:NAD(P)-dependent dehydrogenase (short-subunit alcohol dehydrogenase family)
MDSVAIVTASTEGIGLAIARKLASDGAKVMISSRKVRNIIYFLSNPNPFLLARIRILQAIGTGTVLTKILINFCSDEYVPVHYLC